MSTDEHISIKIDQLIDEEHRLRSSSTGHAISGADQDRMDQIKIELDQLWDWRRQRDALRSAGRDPDEAHERHAAMVENYLQ